MEQQTNFKLVCLNLTPMLKKEERKQNEKSQQKVFEKCIPRKLSELNLLVDVYRCFVAVKKL